LDFVSLGGASSSHLCNVWILYVYLYINYIYTYIYIIIYMIYIYIYICNLVSISLKALLIRPEAWELQGRVCSRQRHHPRWRRCLRPSWAGRIWKDPCLNIDLGMSWNILDYCFICFLWSPTSQFSPRSIC
jgi:hypothetical protein